jgi:hypothetical protein
LLSFIGMKSNIKQFKCVVRGNIVHELELAYMWMGMGWIDPHSCNDGTRNWRDGFGLDAVTVLRSYHF